MNGPADGSNFGRVLEDLLARSRVKARAATLPAEQAATDRFVNAFMERGERELAPMLTAMFADFADNPDAPDYIKALVDATTGPEHQFDWIVQLLAIAAAALGGFTRLAGPVLQNMMNTLWTKYQNVPLPPEAAAAGVVKGVIPVGYAAEEAAKSGLNNNLFGWMVEIAGNPPGPQELGIMLNRGIIDEGAFAKGVRQGLTKTEWTNELLAMRHGPISPGSAVAAAVEGHMDLGAVAAILSANGVDPKYTDVLYETAGRPPGTAELLELLRRGEISEGEVEQAVRESDIKNKYIPAIMKMRKRVPPMERIIAMLRRGVIDAPTAVHKLSQLGYEGDDAAAMVNEAAGEKNQATKDLAMSQITQLYEIQAMDGATATGLLQGLGYDGNEAGMILALADARRAVRAQDAYINRIHNLYVMHKINRTDASNNLDQTNVPSQQRDWLIGLWDLERSANVAQLTLAQLQGAFKRGLFTEDEFLARVEAMGYEPDDARILLYLTAPVSAFGGP